MLVDKKNRSIFCLVGMVIIVVILMPGSPEPIPAVSSSQPESWLHKSAKIGYYEGAILMPTRETIRDPFALPSGFSTSNPEKLPASLSPKKMPDQIISTSEAKSVNEEIPVLTGIVEDSKTQIAIIRYKGISRSYHLGQTVGQYQLTGIKGKTASVLGPQGEWVLLLGR